MIVLFLLACDFGIDLGTTTETTDGDSADTGAAEAETPDMATCLAEGGTLVERGSSTPWGTALVDLEVHADGGLYGLTADGHLLLADPDDLSSLTDLGALGEQGLSLDLRGEQLLVDVGNVKIGTTEADLNAWTDVPYATGDSAISPDGRKVSFSAPICGVYYDTVNVSDGERHYMDMGDSDALPVGFEYLADGRLVAATYVSGQAGLAIFQGDDLVETWTFSGRANFWAPLETLGDDVLTATSGDGEAGTLERANLGSGAHASVTLSFLTTRALALSPHLSWALGTEGELIATDGALVHDLGSMSGVRDLVADAGGAWIATAGEDGVLRVFGCE